MKLLSYISNSRGLLIDQRMGEFIARAMLLVGCVFLIDRGLAMLDQKPNSVFAQVAAAKEEQVARKLSQGLVADIVFIGSSQAEFAFVPEEFGSGAYNAGIGGFIQTNRHYDLLKQVFASGSPKTIIYQLDNIALNNEPKEGVDQIMHMFQSVRLLRNGFSGAFKPAEPLDTTPFSRYEGYRIFDNGWVEGRGEANVDEIRHRDIPFSPNPDAVTYLRKIIDLCKEQKVNLMIIQTPVHSSYLKASDERNRKYLKFMLGIANELDFPFLDFANPSMYPVDDNSLFFDTNHLNSRGARKFSRMVNQEIQKKALILSAR